MYKRLSKVSTKAPMFYCMLNFPRLDALVGRINEGEVITIAARVGCGKTSLALNQVAEFSRYGKCLYVSLEMGSRELLNRIQKTGIRHNLKNIYVCESYKDLEELEHLIKKLDIKFLFIDYIQLMDGSIKQNTRWVKQMALKYNLVVFQMSQLNRLAATQEPKLEMLSTSDKIAHDSDQVWLLTNGKIIVAKNRKGKTGEVYVKFHKNKFLFEESLEFLINRNKIINNCNDLKRKGCFDELFSYISGLKGTIDDQLYIELSTWAKNQYKLYLKNSVGLLYVFKKWKI